MGKKRKESDSSEEDPVPAKKKKEKKQKTEDSAEKKHKEKKHEKEKGEKKKDKEKKEKKEKEKEKNKEEKKEKKEKKEQKEGKEHEVQIKFAPAPEPPRKIGPQAFPPEALEQKDKKQKKEKKEHKRHASMAGPAAVREVMLCSASAFKDKFLLGFFGALWKWDARAGVIVISLCILTSANTTRTCCQLSNYTGLIFSCCMAICWVSFPKASLHFLDFTPHTTKIYQAILWTCCIAFFLIAEMDRIRSDEIAKEGQQLRKHYEGTIRMAGCSQPSDMQNIWEEIGDKVHKVDTAINVLISAGLSSPSLRLAAESGVNIKGAGHAEVAIPFVFLGPQLVVGFSQVVILIMNGAHHSNWASVILEGIAVVARLVFMWLLCRRPADEICFMLKVLTKLVGAVFFPTVLTVGVLVGLHYEAAAKTMSIATFMCFNMALILAVVFACLGITGTLSLPGGRCLVQIFLQRGAWCPSRASTRSISTSESDSGTDTEDSDGSN